MSLRTLAVILWIILQPVVFHWRALISQTTYLPFDLPGFHTPLASVVVERLSQRKFPLWNPYIYAGYPLHADIQAQILYPPAWPAFLISALGEQYTIFYWLEWETVLHISLAGLFTAWLLRRLECSWWTALFGATVYQLGCFFSAQAQHLGAVCGAAWMPLVWLAVAELAKGFSARWFAALAGALGMNLLAGFPSISLIVFGSALALALGYWWSGRARAMLLVWLTAGIGVSLLLAAAQLVPTAIWNPHSLSSWRWKWAGDGGGLPPKVLLTALWPDWFHVLSSELYREPYDITFMYVYNGQAALWLALAAPWLRSSAPVRLFAALAGFFALLMLGTAVPGYKFVFARLPRFVHGMSYVEFTTCAFSLAIAVAAALALHHLTREKRTWIAAAIALATSAELTLVASNRLMNSTSGDWRSVDSSRNYYESDSLLKQLKSLLYERTPPFRTDTTLREYRLASTSPAVRLPSLGGDNPLAPLRLLAYRKLFCESVEWERFYNVKDTASPLLDAGNVGFLLFDDRDGDEEKLKRSGWDRIQSDSLLPLRVFRNQETMPRYFLVSSVKRANSSNEAEALLKTADLRREAIVEGAPPVQEGNVRDWMPVGVISYQPDHVELRVIALGPAYLVVSESWAPGWEARIDGQPAVVYPTNLAFQGLAIPPGAHKVTLEYVPRASYVAAAISAVAWICLAASVWIGRRKTAIDPS